MKKALSVLLVAAAIFGFYGSAVTVKDLLACKDYWEEAGEKSTADMNKLEDGLNQLKDNEQAYLDGQDQLADAEVKLAEGEATLAKGEADYAAAPKKLAKGKADLAAGWSDYNAGKKEYNAGKKQYNDGKKTLDGVIAKRDELKNGFDTWCKMYDMAKQKMDAPKEEGGNPTTAFEDMVNLNKTFILEDEDIDAAIYGAKATAAAKLPEQAGATADNVVDVLKGMVDSAESAMNAAKEAYGEESAQYQAAKGAYDLLKGNYDNLTGGIASLEGMKGLSQGRVEMTKQIKDFVGKMDEETLKEVDPKGEIKKAMQMISVVPDKEHVAAAQNVTFEAIVNSLIGKVDNLINGKKAELAAGKKKLNSAEKQLAAGLKKLRKGERTYAQGLADYKAAPGKLADGRQQLADGYKQYEDGKNKLAEYEDGEQQVRDGLATLFNTKADLDLESIADRLGGDGDFDNGDKHLDIDEGLNAVEVGRGYQADDGVLITKEIMGRAVATGGLIGAGVLAVLAAILSFLKKNKGAAVFALLAAAAGAFGAFYGPTQGTYFSEIAGSTIGTLTWVAAGVLGGVALVHAIAHFAAPKNV